MSWAAPGITVANSHIYVQGQQGYKPAPSATVPTTTIPVATSSTSTTVIGAGGSVNFPVTPVPAQAAAFLTASGLVKTADSPYYHSAFGVPFTLHMVVDEQRPVGGVRRPAIRADLVAAGINTDIQTATSATAAGEALAAGYADMALLPVTFSPYLAQTLAWYTTLLGAPGKNGSQDWTVYDNTQFEQQVEYGLAAAQRRHRSGDLPAGGHPTVGPDGVAAAVRRAGSPRVEPVGRRGPPGIPEHEPVVVRAVLGRPEGGVDQERDANPARAIAGAFKGRATITGR